MPMDLSKYIIAFLIFGVIIAGGILIMGDINNTYPSATKLNDTYLQPLENVTKDMYSMSQDVRNKTFQQEISDEGILDTILKGAYRAIKVLGGSFEVVIVTLATVAGHPDITIPQFFIDACIAAFILAVSIALIYLFMRIIPS